MRRLSLAFAGLLAALTLAAATLALAADAASRVRSEGSLAAGQAFESFRLLQRGADAFELELTRAGSACRYEVTWFRARTAAVVPMLDFQGERRGECAASDAPRVDGALTHDGRGRGVIRLLRDGAEPLELRVESAGEPAP